METLARGRECRLAGLDIGSRSRMTTRGREHRLAVENDGSRSRMTNVIKKVCSYSRFLDICRLEVKKFVIRDGITR